MSQLPEKIPLIIMDSSESPSLFVTHHIKYMVELPSFPSFELEFLVIDTPKGEYLILGFDFLNHFNPSIDWRQGLITFDADHKDYYDSSKYFSNDFSSAKSFAALVGDSRTPSFPSSVHIPSLNSHQSLLSSKDEVFKYIQDVGEDNSVSSLHLFFGNMELPLSSYYDSLEELWDEEEEPEEIETVMKVVPSVYHQYLDVFSKVKAEKLPPHCTCDHHIELEGSLPPIGEALRQFHQLKEAFTTAPILSHFNHSLPTIVETDASDYALDAVLSQVSDSGKHPIAFDSRKILPAEINYEIYDKELLGIIHTRRQARWAEFLSEFQFSITYRPGRLATIPDALSCQDNVYPERGEDFISKNPINYQKIIKQDEIQASNFLAIKVDSLSNLIDSIQKSLCQYSQYRSILEDLGKGKSVQDYSLDSSSKLLVFKDWVVVQNDPTIQLNILQKGHDFPLAEHPGQEKTLKLVKRDFHWSGMTQFIKDYVSSCQQCSRNKNIHLKKFGILKPLPIPNGLWICLSMDFITQLLLSNSFESILVIVDRLSKMAVFIPTMSSITSLDLAHLFIKNSFSKHVLPSSIVSDRGSLFVSSFWTNLCQQLKISRDLSTAYHPETDGQTERVNQILEQYLWMYVSYHQDDCQPVTQNQSTSMTAKIS
ncbi:hypothetical protein O181_080588 [Austropuccinia psidii MF-1]|uniref:Integrase catalytic domain-containing protein n=1 Tax=Austropuccinia psidii MF-1 TaxID=1389203 RepID=A0A9Q3FIX8_9BASI|nr:hypothetical protein [Austropuccinia psidii MF-1]